MKRQLTLMLALMASICYANAQEGNNDVSTTNTDRYYLVTSKDDLHNGDKVIIVGENTKATENDKPYFIMGRYSGSTYYSVMASKNADGSFSPIEGMNILTYYKKIKNIKLNSYYYAFRDKDNKYLYGDTNKNQIKLSSSLDDNNKLNITINPTNYSATIFFNNSSDNNIRCHLVSNTTATFNYFLKNNNKDIYLYRKVSTPTLNETDGNISNVISQYIGTSNVSLERTFYNDSWNTWCMPFEITQEKIHDVFGNATKVYAYTKVENGAMTFTPLVGNLKVGVPYLLWPEKETINPTFNLVDFRSDTEAQTITKDGLSFCGTYAPYQMKEDGTEIFINAKNKLTIPKEGSQKMKGLRAFFRIENGTSSAKISFSDTTDGLSSTEKERQHTDKIYDIKGKFAGTAFNKLNKGIYIINGIKTVKE